MTNAPQFPVTEPVTGAPEGKPTPTGTANPRPGAGADRLSWWVPGQKTRRYDDDEC
ncbi:hypothetical protein Stube_08460 [Streptomyces tubercidicus]|uniref:Uncharacterized protein n=1 Tax=Streptomyces tubercidicus TaxID=47759 RepID=A0A640UJE4_9ACTN|nr:hypothetical protein Stube_08460 [Streptomyces tubercidicus]